MSSPTANAGSVSKIDCLASVRGKGEAKVTLFRHLAPLTVNAVVRTLPFDSRVSLMNPMVCLFTDLKVGVEKPRLQFAKGDVAFLPSGALICVFLGDARSDRPLNPLGNVEEGLESFVAARPGDVVRMSAVQPEPSPAP